MLPAPPAGFVHIGGRDGELVVREELRDACVAAGLERVSGWRRWLEGAAAHGPGRAATARETVGGTPAVLKQLRRGGLLAPLWRERFAGITRVWSNLAVPVAALQRGVPTPSPLALFVAPGPPGLFRGWLAVEALPGADLWTRLARGETPGESTWRAVLEAIRAMHDAGIEHRDLNLGNVLLEDPPPGRVHVLDLDGGRVHPGRLESSLRAAALERLERSHVKLFAGRGMPAPAVRWRELYADGDRRLLDAVRPRAGAALRLALHRAGWRR